MIKPAQAEILATEKLQEYIAACGCKTQEDNVATLKQITFYD